MDGKGREKDREKGERMMEREENDGKGREKDEKGERLSLREKD